MKKSLVIVESPSKAKTINKYLGSNFTVKASVGHIRDLPENRLGVETEKQFEPEYVTIKGKQKTISELKKAAKNSDEIYIATDPDREGEAIAWHIAEEIGDNKIIHRALFNEITHNAVQAAIDNPFPIDNNKVDAQQARRVLDRLVGYKVSPFLWKTLFKGNLSAGRVQSVALKLISERENSIRIFESIEYWTIHIDLNTPDKEILLAKLAKFNGKKADIPDEKSAQTIKQLYENETFAIKSIQKKKVKRNPLPPFITSTLQQEASNRAGYPPKKTMFIAQQLYEGIELGGEGSVALITYVRTDSMRMSSEALSALRGFIDSNYGSDYLPEKPRTYKTKSKGKVQDAHECIRPTYFTRPPDTLKNHLSKEQYMLYSMIWNRTVASQMKEAISNQTSVAVTTGPCDFTATGSELLFQGFLRVWKEAPKNEEPDEKDEISNVIPTGLTEGMILSLLRSDLKQHFTKPPARYTDSSLVKELELLGIGRPSTYAQIVATLITRNYVTRDSRKLIPSELGEVVNKIIVKGFPEIFDVNFTASMETELDQIESGKKNYLDVVSGFYKPFQENLDRVFQNIKTVKQEIIENAGFTCEKCGKEMLIRWSKNGRFYACSGFPDCKNTLNIEKREDSADSKTEAAPTGLKCDKCGKDLVIRKGRRGPFYACSGFPSCKNTMSIAKDSESAGPKTQAAPTGITCQECGKDMVIRKGKRGPFYGCSGYPKCKNTMSIVKGAETAKPETKDM